MRAKTQAGQLGHAPPVRQESHTLTLIGTTPLIIPGRSAQSSADKRDPYAEFRDAMHVEHDETRDPCTCGLGGDRARTSPPRSGGDARPRRPGGGVTEGPR